MKAAKQPAMLGEHSGVNHEHKNDKAGFGPWRDGHGGGAMAQSTASATATASATMLQPITITKNSDLNFGAIFARTIDSSS
jgi:hypothetical protein